MQNPLGPCLYQLRCIKGWRVFDSYISKLPPSSGKRGSVNSRGQFRTRSEQPAAPVAVTPPSRRESHPFPKLPVLRRTSKLEAPPKNQTRRKLQVKYFPRWSHAYRIRRYCPGQPRDGHLPLALRTHSSSPHRHICSTFLNDSFRFSL